MPDYKPDWEFTLETIKNHRCVLLLGPEAAAIDKNGKTYHQELVEKLNIEANDHVVSYYDHEELFLFRDSVSRTKMIIELKKVYRTPPANMEMFTQLAAIPFHIILTTMPLPIMEETLNGNHHSAFFNMIQPQTEIPEPTVDAPLVYGLTGSLKSYDSLILTHDDLFKYLSAILANQNLPTEIKSQLQEAELFLFLGFSFDKWYVQLLLRLLNLHKESSFLRYAANQKINADVVAFCEEQFRIEFVKNDIEAFVDELSRRWEAEVAKQGPAKAGNDSQTFKERILSMLEKDRLEEAIPLLLTRVREMAGKELENDLIQISGNLSNLNQMIKDDILDHTSARQARNKIRLALIQIVNELPDDHMTN